MNHRQFPATARPHTHAALALGVLLAFAHLVGAVESCGNSPRVALERSGPDCANTEPNPPSAGLFEWEGTSALDPATQQCPSLDEVVRTAVFGSGKAPLPFWEQNKIFAGLLGDKSVTGKPVSTKIRGGIPKRNAPAGNVPDAGSARQGKIPEAAVSTGLSWVVGGGVAMVAFLAASWCWRRRLVWMLILD